MKKLMVWLFALAFTAGMAMAAEGDAGAAGGDKDKAKVEHGRGGGAGLVKKLDTNGDGKLDADELGKAEPKVKEMLLKRDKNADGVLDADELKARGEHGKGDAEKGGKKGKK